MSNKRLYDQNNEIKALVAQKGAERTNYSQEELAFVNKFVGYGGMGKFGATGKRLLSEYYTPVAIVERMIALCEKHGFSQGSLVLEPSCGTGNFLHYLSPETKVVGCEIDPTSYAIAKLNFPNFDIRNQYFNELFVDRRGNPVDFVQEFNLVIGNPPYGDFIGKFTRAEKELLKPKTYVDYFIYRGLQLLVKGGLLCYIVPSAFLNSDKDELKEKIYSIGTLIDAYRLPKGSFDHTDIQTDIILIKRK